MRSLMLLCIALSTVAPAAERKVFVSSFDRLRVNGPFRVDVVTGRSPAGRIVGDPRGLDGIEVRQEGNVVVVRASDGRGNGESDPAAWPVTVTLVTPSLAAVTLVGSGAVNVAGMKADRLDLSVAGTGTIGVTRADAIELTATTIGTGRITVAGRVARARVVVNGAGNVVATALDVGELTVRLDGPGDVTARARFIADVTNTGLGRVAVAGSAKCQVKAVTTGSVVCGAGNGAGK